MASIWCPRKLWISWPLSFVAFEPAEFLAGLQVPQPDEVIVAADEGAAPVGREGDAFHAGRVAGQAAELLAGRHVPEDRSPVVSTREDAAAVGREVRVDIPAL